MRSMPVFRSFRSLGRPPYHENVRYNRRQWDDYAAGWDRRRVTVEDETLPADERPQALRVLGDEWGRRADVDRVVDEWIRPYLRPESSVAEIGSGGGRIAAKILADVSRLTCFDVSRKMLEVCRRTLHDDPRAEFVYLEEPAFSARFAGRFDFVYAFDVFVHLDLHTMWKYLRALPDVLAPGGKALIHTANLCAPGGWRNFARQDHYTVETHYFVVPQLVETLFARAGLRVVAVAPADAQNFYYDRDYLAIVERA